MLTKFREIESHRPGCDRCILKMAVDRWQQHARIYFSTSRQMAPNNDYNVRPNSKCQVIVHGGP
jgi:hypothetical protein